MQSITKVSKKLDRKKGTFSFRILYMLE